MPDTVAQQIASINTILLVIPTNSDYSRIFAGVALGMILKDKRVTILNDAITTKEPLIQKLKDFHFTALHTKASKSVTLIINKAANNITQSFIDETDEKISISFEMDTQEIKTESLVELKKAKIDQDIALVLGEKGGELINKYNRIISQFPDDKVRYISPVKTLEVFQLWVNVILTSSNSVGLDASILTLLTASLLSETDMLSTIVHKGVFDTLKLLLDSGASYSDARNLAGLFQNSALKEFYSLDMTSSKNIGNGIYISHIVDSTNVYNISPPYLPNASHFFDCKIAIAIIQKPKHCKVFIANNKPQYDLSPIISEYKGEGNNNSFYFKSTKHSSEVEQDIVRKLINITMGSVAPSEMIVLDETKQSEQEIRFTQGLSNDDPLSSAIETKVITKVPTPVEAPTNNGNDVKIVEEC